MLVLHAPFAGLSPASWLATDLLLASKISPIPNLALSGHQACGNTLGFSVAASNLH